MAKRSPRNPKRDDSETAESVPMVEAVRPKTNRSRTSATEPVESADDSSGGVALQDAPSPSEEDIRRRAYHRYLQRGGGHGMDFDDWLEAERELKDSKR